MKTTREAKHPVSYPRIITFFVTATVLSNIFRFDIFELRSQLTVLPSPIYILSIVLIEGSGIFIAALWMMNHLRKARKTEMTLYGTSDRKWRLVAGRFTHDGLRQIKTATKTTNKETIASREVSEKHAIFNPTVYMTDSSLVSNLPFYDAKGQVLQSKRARIKE